MVKKVKGAQSLEEDLYRAARQIELSMIQKCKLAPKGDNTTLTHDMKATHRQVTKDQTSRAESETFEWICWDCLVLALVHLLERGN